MQGLVTLLPEPYYAEVLAVWNELEARHGLRGVRVTPFPHFTWQLADYDRPRLQQIAAAFARRTPRFIVRTAGLGIFSGPRPVLYIPVVKTAMLLRVHADLWESARPTGAQFSPYYGPGDWLPHITLAFEDLNAGNLGAVLQDLALRPFAWEMRADNLTFLDQPDGIHTAIEWQLPLSG